MRTPRDGRRDDVDAYAVPIVPNKGLRRAKSYTVGSHLAGLSCVLQYARIAQHRARSLSSLCGAPVGKQVWGPIWTRAPSIAAGTVSVSATRRSLSDTHVLRGLGYSRALVTMRQAFIALLLCAALAEHKFMDMKYTDLLALMDTDGDAVLTKAEIKGWPKTWVLEDLHKEYLLFGDENRDDILQQHEFVQLMESRNADRSKREL